MNEIVKHSRKGKLISPQSQTHLHSLPSLLRSPVFSSPCLFSRSKWYSGLNKTSTENRTSTLYFNKKTRKSPLLKPFIENRYFSTKDLRMKQRRPWGKLPGSHFLTPIALALRIRFQRGWVELWDWFGKSLNWARMGVPRRNIFQETNENYLLIG